MKPSNHRAYSNLCPFLHKSRQTSRWISLTASRILTAVMPYLSSSTVSPSMHTLFPSNTPTLQLRWSTYSSRKCFAYMACLPQLLATKISFSSVTFESHSSSSTTFCCRSSTYHPQSDGQTEVLNHTLEHFLLSFVRDKPTSWVEWLPWAEWLYNTVAEWLYNTTYHSPLPQIGSPILRPLQDPCSCR